MIELSQELYHQEMAQAVYEHLRDFLLTKEKAKALKAGVEIKPAVEPLPEVFPAPEPTTPSGQKPDIEPSPVAQTCTLRLVGSIPPELWNRLGTKILAKLRSGTELQVGVDFRVSIKADGARSMKAELNQALDDLGLSGKVIIEES